MTYAVTRRPVPVVSEPWLSDQNDADNWLVIPEFGISPVDVDFKGFAFPILTPSSGQLRERHRNIRTLVTFIRSKIRGHFNTLADVRAAYLRVLDAVLPAKRTSAMGGNMSQLSQDDKHAAFYVVVMQALHSATSDLLNADTLKEPGNAALKLSDAAVWLTRWLSNDLDAHLRSLQNAAEARATPRHKENRQVRGEAVAWYEAHRDQFSSKDAAAQAMTKVFPMKFTTLRKWIKGI